MNTDICKGISINSMQLTRSKNGLASFVKNMRFYAFKFDPLFVILFSPSKRKKKSKGIFVKKTTCIFSVSSICITYFYFLFLMTKIPRKSLHKIFAHNVINLCKVAITLISKCSYFMKA